MAQPRLAPHPATVAQPRLAPHPATVAQPRTIAVPEATPPHAATLAQPKPSVTGLVSRPPHTATLPAERAAQPKIKLANGTILSDSTSDDAQEFLKDKDPAARQRLAGWINNKELEYLENQAYSELVRELLGEVLSSGQYVFNNPPLNSSGDIYHTVGFLAILDSLGLNLPAIRIGYFASPTAAKDDTEKQADRGVEFAEALGFGSQVSKISVEHPGSDQLNPRAKATRTAIFTQGHGRILDQKVSTALISVVIEKIGRKAVTDMIRERFTRSMPEAAQAASTAWQEAQWEKIHQLVGEDKKLVLFNERIATNQTQHNSEGAVFNKIRDKLGEKKDVVCYTLRTDGEPDQSSSLAFAGAGPEGDRWNLKGFNTKVQHLQLLKLIKDKLGIRLLGIYGSTSGTLDAAALIGIKTLSLHEFSTAKRVNEQSQREYLMAPFKHVVRRNTRDPIKVLEDWIGDHYEGIKVRETGALASIYKNAITRKASGSGEAKEGIGSEIEKLLKSLLEKRRIETPRKRKTTSGQETPSERQDTAPARQEATGEQERPSERQETAPAKQESASQQQKPPKRQRT